MTHQLFEEDVDNISQHLAGLGGIYGLICEPEAVFIVQDSAADIGPNPIDVAITGTGLIILPLLDLGRSFLKAEAFSDVATQVGRQINRRAEKALFLISFQVQQQKEALLKLFSTSTSPALLVRCGRVNGIKFVLWDTRPKPWISRILDRTHDRLNPMSARWPGP